MLVKPHDIELAAHDVTVSGVAPRFDYTEMIRHVMERPEFRTSLEKRHPARPHRRPQGHSGPGAILRRSSG
jgi:hypothetical protein